MYRLKVAVTLYDDQGIAHVFRAGEIINPGVFRDGDRLVAESEAAMEKAVKAAPRDKMVRAPEVKK